MEVRVSGVDKVVKQLERYKKKLQDKQKMLIQKLAELGVQVADSGFARVSVDGKKDIQPGQVLWGKDDSTAYVVVTGETVLIVEFGAGITMGYWHPLAQEMGYGPGSWSDDPALNGKGLWDRPGGWKYPGSGKNRSLGNKPAKAMYEASQRIRSEVSKAAREVFGNG